MDSANKGTLDLYVNNVIQMEKFGEINTWQMENLIVWIV